MIISNILSALVYVGTLYLFPKELIVSVMDGQFFLYVFIILAVSWLPFFLIKLILKRIDPNDY
jgi:hypothetical protein